ncbi:MAG: DUF4340 domain-containing protein [Candidatus Sericytochromatia bacterium]|nr:DUF4340 domain-containing protein [Candidatus Sericytochromatia bacterium]
MKFNYTLGMLVVLVALMTYVIAFERSPQEATLDASTAAKANILAQDAEAVQALEVDQNAPSVSIALQRGEDKNWVFADGQPADAERIALLLTRLSPWQAAEVLFENQSEVQLADFGLEPPALIMRLKTATGTETVHIGNKTPTSSGYYVRRDGDPRIYLAYVNVPEDLERLVAEPPVPSASPAAAAQPQ